MLKKLVSILTFCLSFAMLVNIAQAQDTLTVKLGPTNLTDDTFESLKSSEVLLNHLIPAQKYKLKTISGPDSSAELLGLRELNVDEKPSGFIPSNTVIKSANLLMGKSGNGNEINEILNEDIGVLKGSVASRELGELTQFYHTYRSVSSLYADYFNGKIDYIITEASIAKNILQNRVEGTEINILNRDLFESQMGFWVSENNADLQTFINERIANFKNGSKFENFKETYFTVPRDYSSLLRYLSIAAIVLLLGGTITYAYKNQDIIKQYIKSYKLELNGLMQIRPLPGIRFVDNEGEIKNHFQESYAKFQKEHPNINVAVDFNNTSVKLRFNSGSDIKISDKDYLSMLADDIEDMISVFPTDQFIIDLNISGSYSNVQGEHKFSIINKDTQVEVVDSEIENKAF